MKSFAKAAVLAALLTAGQSQVSMAATTIKIGVENGPHAEIAELVKKQVVKDGIDLKITEFSDYTRPNPAVNDGDLDANAFQHKPYLDQQVKDRGFKLTAVAPIVVFPIGVYSAKIKSLDSLSEGAKFAIPNDPSNGGRALLLLQSKGLITLKDGSGITPTVLDIVSNPKKLKIVEVDAAQVPHYLPDVEAAVINTNYAIQAKLDPAKDAIAREDANSPYVNILVVRTADVDKDWVKALVKAYHSAEVKDYILNKYPGVVVPGF